MTDFDSVPELLDSIEKSDEYTVILVRGEAGEFVDEVDLPPYLRFDSSQIDRGPRIEYEESVPARADFTIPWNPEIESWILQDMFIYFNGMLLFRGELLEVNSSYMSQQTDLGAMGIFKKLQRGGGSYEFSHMPYAKAIEQYLDEEVPDFEYEVTEPDWEVVDEGQRTYNAWLTSAFEQAFDNRDDLPFTIENDRVKLLRQCWPMGAWRNARTASGSATDLRFSDNAENGRYLVLVDGPDRTNNPHRGEYAFEVEYTIPSIFFGCKVRDTYVAARNTPAYEWTLEFPNGREYELDYDDEVGTGTYDTPLNWTEVALHNQTELRGRSYDGPDLEPGEYKVKCKVTQSIARGEPSDDTTQHQYFIDVVAPYDARYIPDKWDSEWNTLHEPGGYLDGPYLAGAAAIETELFEDSFAVTRGDVTADLNNYENGQKIQLSNDNGNTWLPTGSSSENTDRVGVRFTDTYGTSLRSRIYLDSYTPNGTPRNNDTPRYRFDYQEISEYELLRDTSTRSVVDETSVEGDHYSNLKNLHDDANMIFIPIHKEDELRLESFEPGDKSHELDAMVLDWAREIDATNYANTVTLQGAEREDGTRPRFTWFNSGEIEQFGEVLSPEEIRSDAETGPRLRSLGLPILRSRVNERKISGQMTIVPQMFNVGYSYTDERFDNEPVVLRRLTFDDGGGRPTGRLDFKLGLGIAETLRGFDRDIERLR